MAYCEYKNRIEQESSGSWAKNRVAYHHARCVLCRLLETTKGDGTVSASTALNLGLIPMRSHEMPGLELLHKTW